MYLKCDQYAFIAEDVSAMMAYIEDHHNHGRVNCHVCNHEAPNSDDLKTHMYEIHPEVVMIYTMAQQVNSISDDFTGFEALKGEVGKCLKMILDNQNSMKQELFLARNKQAEVIDKNTETGRLSLGSLCRKYRIQNL